MPTRRRGPVYVRLDWDIAETITVTDVAEMIELEPKHPNFSASISTGISAAVVTEGIGTAKLLNAEGKIIHEDG